MVAGEIRVVPVQLFMLRQKAAHKNLPDKRVYLSDRVPLEHDQLRQLSRQIGRWVVTVWQALRGPLGGGGIFGDMPLPGAAAFDPNTAEDAVKMAAHIPAFGMWLPWNETV